MWASLVDILLHRGPTVWVAIGYGGVALGVLLKWRMRTRLAFWAVHWLAFMAFLGGLSGHILGRINADRDAQALWDGTYSGDPLYGLSLMSLTGNGYVDHPLYVGIICWAIPVFCATMLHERLRFGVPDTEDNQK